MLFFFFLLVFEKSKFEDLENRSISVIIYLYLFEGFIILFLYSDNIIQWTPCFFVLRVEAEGGSLISNFIQTKNDGTF